MEISIETRELARAIAKAQYLLNDQLRGRCDDEVENRADRFAEARWLDYVNLAAITRCMLLERDYDVAAYVELSD